MFQLGLVGSRHTLLLFVEDAADLAACIELHRIAAGLTGDRIATYAVLSASADGLDPAVAAVPCLLDADGEYQATYQATGGAGHLIRPDGHLGFRAAPLTATLLRDHLSQVFTVKAVSPTD